jgi:hypothetical protein
MNPESLHLLNWALIAISFFNTIVLLWLGLTVLLNADQRALRTWTAGGGLVLCGLFFAGHSAVVSHTPGTIGPHINFWWRISWLPLIGAPYLWYVVMASYAGVLKSAIHTIALTLITAVGLIALVRCIACCASCWRYSPYGDQKYRSASWVTSLACAHAPGLSPLQSCSLHYV